MIPEAELHKDTVRRVALLLQAYHDTVYGPPEGFTPEVVVKRLKELAEDGEIERLWRCDLLGYVREWFKTLPDEPETDHYDE